MQTVLLAWVGLDDVLRAEGDRERSSILAEALSVAGHRYDHVLLISDFPERRTRRLVESLVQQTSTPIEVELERLSSPVDYAEIHAAADRSVKRAFERHGTTAALHFLLSTGTPPMGSVWLLLGKSRYPATLVAWTRSKSLEVVKIPFEISAEFVPQIVAARDHRLEEMSREEAPASAAFADIVHRCASMRRLIQRAEIVARRAIPVLLEGESGTGKEMVARAIHNAGPRAGKPMIVVNCGAIARELMESEFFGHRRGAFTGANADRLGHFREANGGTLFLDEIGELPLSMQVKLLRPLQDREVVAVGASQPDQVDVRIIAATNRNLLAEVSQGRFREDLYYRLAVAVLRMPALREREGDLGPLIDALLTRINGESAELGDGTPRRLAPGARNRLAQHPWPGNVRELQNTLRRAALFAPAPTITAVDVGEALLAAPAPAGSSEHRPLGDGFVLRNELDEIAKRFLKRALEQAEGNRSKAARLLGFNNHQTLSNWLRRLEVES